MDLNNIIPSGNGGINGEGRTLKEICEHPVPEHLIKKLDEERLAPEVVNRMKADLARMGSSRVPQPALNGQVDFSAIAWPGVSARLPEKDGLIAAIRQNYPGISLDDITPRSIRDITGRIEIVPNNVHRFKQLYAHKGYVSKMLKLINGKEVADEDE